VPVSLAAVTSQHEQVALIERQIGPAGSAFQ